MTSAASVHVASRPSACGTPDRARGRWSAPADGGRAFPIVGASQGARQGLYRSCRSSSHRIPSVDRAPGRPSATASGTPHAPQAALLDPPMRRWILTPRGARNSSSTTRPSGRPTTPPAHSLTPLAPIFYDRLTLRSRCVTARRRPGGSRHVGPRGAPRHRA